MRIGYATLLLLGLTACFSESKSEDAGAVTSFHVDIGADEKQLLNNLVGRWYPRDEVTRLSDRSLTAKEWCEREPATIFVVPEKVEVRCAKGTLFSAAIAGTKREKDGVIAITLRSREDGKLKQLRVHAEGPNATISGSPCFEGAVEYARFPEYEILTRDILGGQRCAQLAADDGDKEPPKPVP